MIQPLELGAGETAAEIAGGTTGIVPVPVSGTVSGLFGSLVVMTSVPVRTPAAVGVKVTFIVQLADVVMGAAAQVLDGKPKSPVASMSEIDSGFAPMFVRVIERGVLVVFTPCLPKSNEAGVTEAAEDAAAGAAPAMKHSDITASARTDFQMVCPHMNRSPVPQEMDRAEAAFLERITHK